MVNFDTAQRYSKAFKQLGNGLIGSAMQIEMLNQMNKCYGQPSIFGGCCGGGFSPYNLNANPMGIGIFGNNNFYQNQMNTQYGNMLAYNWGAQLAAQIHASNANAQPHTPTQLPKTNNEYAGDVKDQDTTKGKDFDKATNDMVDKEGNAIDGKSYTICEKPQNEDEYKSHVTELGKSYLAEIDNTVGNGDGKLTLDEFVKHELKKLPSDASTTKKEQAKANAQTAFNKIDQNGDGYADYKELASTISTMDQNFDSKDKVAERDGKITSKEYEQWSTLLSDSTNTTFDKYSRSIYNKLFGKK